MRLRTRRYPRRCRTRWGRVPSPPRDLHELLPGKWWTCSEALVDVVEQGGGVWVGALLGPLYGVVHLVRDGGVGFIDLALVGPGLVEHALFQADDGVEFAPLFE